jgi:Rieske Fe-S protein
MGDGSQDLPRRGLLLNTLKGVMVATLAAIAYPVLWFLRPRRATVSGAQEIAAPFTVKELAAGNMSPFDFAGRPCLVVLTPEGSARLAKGDRLRSDDVRAFDAVCTHTDCTVKFRSENSDIFCSCHEGVYDLNGHNVSGPPPRPLESYLVNLVGEAGKEQIMISRKS